MRGHGTSSRQWCSVGLQLLCFCFCHSITFWAAAMTWTCGIDSVPVENIPVLSATQEGGRPGGRPGGRRMLSGSNAIVLPRHEGERGTMEDELDGGINNNAANQTISGDPADDTAASLFNPSEKDALDEGESAETIAYQEGRECICAILLPTDDTFYCPSPTDHCTVWIRRFHDDYSVSCYERKGWTVGFARHVWYYLSFILLMMVLYPIFTETGRHAVRYIISKCFPRMNVWITDQLLQTEIEVRARIRDEMRSEERLRRQTEGFISGYSLKTKLYSCNDVDEKSETDECDPEIDSKESDLIAQDAPQDCRTSDNDIMCTICLLEVEDGEQIADLSCGHLYHADCLGEWILKKNSCPLCQNPNIARAIRSFEVEDDGNSANNSSSESRPYLQRLRNSARDSFLDVATGRSRRGRRSRMSWADE